MRVMNSQTSQFTSIPQDKKRQVYAVPNSNSDDKFIKQERTTSTKLFKLIESGNTLRLISFKALQNPYDSNLRNPAIRTNLDEIEYYQKTIKDSKNKKSLLNSIYFKAKVKRNIYIDIYNAENRRLGTLPRSITNKIGKHIVDEPDAFKFSVHEVTEENDAELTNIILNIEYTGKKRAEVQKEIDSILYKDAISPEIILNRILNYKETIHGNEIGAREKKETQEIINTILNTINDSSNQKILLIGHNKPDGDTIGCCMGLKAALDYMNKEQVDIAIDDYASGFLKSIIPPKDIKKSSDFYSGLKEGLNKRIQDVYVSKTEISKLYQIMTLIDTKKHYLDNASLLKPNEKYDLAIFLDVPSPGKVSPAIKEYAKNAKKIIYIDHHPVQKREWDTESKANGISLQKIKNDKLFWVEPKVPANTILVTSLIQRLIPNIESVAWRNYILNDKKGIDFIKKLSTNLAIGTITDTSGFDRSINESAEDLALPANQKGDFSPSGIFFWLLRLTHGEENKRSTQKKMSNSLSDKPSNYFSQSLSEFYNTGNNREILTKLGVPLSAIQNSTTQETGRQTIGPKKFDDTTLKTNIAKDARKNIRVFPEIGLGLLKIPYSSIKRFTDEYNVMYPEGNMGDIIDVYKYNEETKEVKTQGNSKYPEYQVDPKYDEDKIIVTIKQNEVKNELNSKMHVAKTDSISFSFRSKKGSDYALILATLFGGGGHDAASGANISIPGLTLDSKLAIKINGKRENDMEKIYESTYNCYIDNYLHPEKTNDIEITMELANDGLSIDELLQGMVKQIRKNSR